MRVAASGASRSRLFTAPSMSWISRSPMGCRGRLALVVRASSSWSRMQSPSWFGSRHRRRSSDGLRARSFGTLGAPGAGEGSAHQIAALVAWLRAHGVDFTDRAAFCRVRGMGVGGVATRDFAQGDVIFSLPLRAPVSTADPPAPLVMTTSIVTSHVGPLGRLGRALAVAGLTLPTRDLAASPGPSHRLGGVVESHHDFPLHASRVSLLALGILHQCAHAAGQNPNDAHWRAYVNLLPRETDALVEWSDEELRMLQGSAHAARASARRDLVDAIHGDVVSALLRADPGLFGAKAAEAVTSRDAFRWAFATALARAFEFPDLPGPGGVKGETGLCPGLDLFNHGSEAERCAVEGLDEASPTGVGAGGANASPGALGDVPPRFPSTFDSSGSEDADESALEAFGPRVTLRAGVGGAEPGEQLLHEYADHACGGALLEFGFTHRVADDDPRADPRRDLHAADVSLAPLLDRGDDGANARRLQHLAKIGLCRGLTFEASNVAPKRRWDAADVDEAEAPATFVSLSPFVDDGDGDDEHASPRGAGCLPFDAHRIARVLTLSPSEVDAVSDWDDDDAGAYDGAQPFGASHERRTLAAPPDVVRGELARYESTRGDVSATTPEEDDAILRALMNESGGETTTPGWIADRPEVAGCVETVVAGGSFAAERDEAARAARWRRRAIAAVTTRRGEKLLLAEIAKDLEARARAA